MILKYSIGAAVLFAAVMLALQWSRSVDPAGANMAIAERVLEAVERKDYAAFMAQADKSVRKMRAEDFRALAESHAPRLRGGHNLQPLDDRWRGEVQVSRWKVIFKDGSPDAVIMLGLRDGKVASFAIY